MKITQTFFAMLVLGFIFLNVSAEEQKGNLTVIVKGLRNDKGSVFSALYNSEKDFLTKKVFAYKIANIQNGSARMEFSDLPYGIYAIACFHDENNNRKFDKGAFSIPLEGYGFSNDAKVVMAPPSFKDASLNINTQAKEIIITVRY